MLSKLRQIRWPWKKRTPSELPTRTADALRRLYYRHQRQRRLWGYIVLTALLMTTLFLAFSLLTKGGFWVVAIPLIVLIFSIYQIRRNRDLSRLLRQALAIQSQIDKAQEEAQAQDGDEAGQASINADGALPAESDRSRSGNGRTNGSVRKGGREQEEGGEPAGEEGSDPPSEE